MKVENSFEQYIHSCWKRGWKISKIKDNWEHDISEKDIQDMFKLVVEKEFEL